MIVNDPEENYRTGYISLFRSIRHHWIFENDKYFKWWVIVLMEANHTERKMPLGYKLYEISKGQSANSLRTWSNLFNTGTKQVVKFLDLLESDGMINRKIIGKGKQSTTLITIENYTQYQGKRETQETTQQTTQGKRNGLREGYTNNNSNNSNNSNKGIKEKKKTTSKEIVIPPFEEFEEYALLKAKELKIDLCPTRLEAKYKSWKENDWHNGYNNKILRWKGALLNTLIHLQKEKEKSFGKKEKDNHVPSPLRSTPITI